MRRVCLHVFGCQMNKLDAELVAEALVAAGHATGVDEDEADVILFVTCSVRDHAEQRVLSRLAQLRARKEREPRLLIGVLGCFAQRAGETLRETCPHVDLVCGTRRFPEIARLLEQAEAGPVVETEEVSLTAPGAAPAHARGLHRGIQAFVSVMRGCNNFCRYCIVPHVRGREESRPVAAVAEEVRALAARGAREITLLGQNIDAYGKDIGTDLAALLRAIHDTDGLLRIRFVTSHPRDVTERLVKTVAELPKVCDHFHMPAQSGSTRVLEAMGRGYTREEYDDRLGLIAHHAPAALVTSDFIVGFPGETKEDFEKTLDLVERARFQNSYIFKYSPRPGTYAAEHMADDVPESEKKRRNQALLAAQEAVNRSRSESLVGSTQTLLVEGVSPRDAEKLIGRTVNNLIAVFPKPDDPAEAPAGALVTLRITHATPLTLFGERID